MNIAYAYHTPTVHAYTNTLPSALYITGKLYRVDAHVNVTAAIGALLLLILFLSEIAAFGRGQVFVCAFTVGALRARLGHERIVS